MGNTTSLLSSDKIINVLSETIKENVNESDLEFRENLKKKVTDHVIKELPYPNSKLNVFMENSINNIVNKIDLSAVKECIKNNENIDTCLKKNKDILESTKNLASHMKDYYFQEYYAHNAEWYVG